MNLGINSAKVLAILIQENDISHLQVNRNQINDNGVEILSRVLQINKSLIHVDLAQNELSSNGALFLFDALQKNESVISLDMGSYDGLYRNKLGTTGLKMLKHILS